MKIKQLAHLLLLACLFPYSSYAQLYNDVAVIVNDSSQASIDIGNYFQQQRNIPSQNMIYVTCTTNEIIDSLEFEAIRQQIETYLVTNNLQDAINYLVTTKGMPLRIEKGGCDPLWGYAGCSSFDSELTLLLTSQSNTILGNNYTNSNYFDVDTNFSRAAYDMYLVTRLDGYTKQEVRNLIDRSGPNTLVNKNSTNFVFDLSAPGASQSLYLAYENELLPASNLLNNAGWTSTYDGNDPVLYQQSNVLGFSSLHDDTTTIPLNYSWVNGSFAHPIFSFGAVTFYDSLNPNLITLLPDLIREGATSGCAYTQPPYLHGTLRNNLFFNYYFDTTNNYNLAESMYMSLIYVSNQQVLIGDPKTTIRIDNTAGEELISIDSKIEVYPNPTAGSFTLSLQDIQSSKIDISIYDQVGKIIYNEVLQGGQISPIALPINLSGQSHGMYFIHILTEEGRAVKKIVLSN